MRPIGPPARLAERLHPALKWKRKCSMAMSRLAVAAKRIEPGPHGTRPGGPEAGEDATLVAAAAPRRRRRVPHPRRSASVGRAGGCPAHAARRRGGRGRGAGSAAAPVALGGRPGGRRAGFAAVAAARRVEPVRRPHALGQAADGDGGSARACRAGNAAVTARGAAT